MFYFLAPTRDTPPDTTIRLGSIIEKPDFADEPLNTTPVPIDPGHMTRAIDENYNVNINNTRTHSVGIWASFLMQILGVGGDIGTELDKSNTEEWKCDKLETIWFRPSTEYIVKSVENPDIAEYVRDSKSWLRDTRLYTVTGIKIAHGASGTIAYARKKGVHLHLGVDATQTGVPVQLGPDIGSEKGRDVSQSYGKKDSFVLAFRLQGIKISSKGTIRHKALEGGLLSIDTDIDQEPIELVVDGLDDHDAGAGDFGIDDSWEVRGESPETVGCSLTV